NAEDGSRSTFTMALRLQAPREQGISYSTTEGSRRDHCDCNEQLHQVEAQIAFARSREGAGRLLHDVEGLAIAGQRGERERPGESGDPCKRQRADSLACPERTQREAQQKRSVNDSDGCVEITEHQLQHSRPAREIAEQGSGEKQGSDI